MPIQSFMFSKSSVFNRETYSGDHGKWARVEARASSKIGLFYAQADTLSKEDDDWKNIKLTDEVKDQIEEAEKQIQKELERGRNEYDEEEPAETMGVAATIDMVGEVDEGPGMTFIDTYAALNVDFFKPMDNEHLSKVEKVGFNAIEGEESTQQDDSVFWPGEEEAPVEYGRQTKDIPHEEEFADEIRHLRKARWKSGKNDQVRQAVRGGD